VKNREEYFRTLDVLRLVAQLAMSVMYDPFTGADQWLHFPTNNTLAADLQQIKTHGQSLHWSASFYYDCYRGEYGVDIRQKCN